MKDVKKLHGFLVMPRHALLLQNDLGFYLFGLYISLILCARWDRRDPKIGQVIGTQAEIADMLGLSQSNLSRALKRLEAKRYIIKHKRYILLKYFPLFLSDVAKKIHSKNYVSLHELYADVYYINAELQRKYADVQESRTQNTYQSLYISSKNNLTFSSEYLEDELYDTDPYGNEMSEEVSS